MLINNYSKRGKHRSLFIHFETARKIGLYGVERTFEYDGRIGSLGDDHHPAPLGVLLGHSSYLLSDLTYLQILPQVEVIRKRARLVLVTEYDIAVWKHFLRGNILERSLREIYQYFVAG